MDNNKWDQFKSSTSTYYKKNGLKSSKSLIPLIKNVNILWDNIKNALNYAKQLQVPVIQIDKNKSKDFKSENICCHYSLLKRMNKILIKFRNKHIKFY